MGAFNSSPFSSDSTQFTEARTQNVSFSDVRAASNLMLDIGGKKNSIILTDQGALQVAGDIAAQAFDQVELTTQSAAGSIGQAVEAVAESAREETENLVANFKTVAIYGVIAWGVVALARSFKK